MNKLTTEDFWIGDRENYDFKRHSDDHGINVFIRKYIPATCNGSCIELGSFPGPFLATFGDLGYVLNGVDFHPLNENKLPGWLKKLGLKTNRFITSDIFNFKTSEKYDVVASFGFIEHFVDYKDMILRHAALVKKDGYIIITTPNFRGRVQHWLHRVFDKENLAKHNVRSMDPHDWKNILGPEGFSIIYCGYFGDFWFWHGHEHLPLFRRMLLWFIDRTIPRIRKLLWFQSCAFSAYAGIVARRTI